jgi:hypothetical protein
VKVNNDRNCIVCCRQRIQTTSLQPHCSTGYGRVRHIIHHDCHSICTPSYPRATSQVSCSNVFDPSTHLLNLHTSVFEHHHRFAGWLGLAFTWILVILSVGQAVDHDRVEWHWSGREIVHYQKFWFSLFITIL